MHRRDAIQREKDNFIQTKNDFNAQIECMIFLSKIEVLISINPARFFKLFSQPFEVGPFKLDTWVLVYVRSSQI